MKEIVKRQPTATWAVRTRTVSTLRSRTSSTPIRTRITTCGSDGARPAPAEVIGSRNRKRSSTTRTLPSGRHLPHWLRERPTIRAATLDWPAVNFERIRSFGFLALNLNLVGSRMLPALENGLPTGFVDCETGDECSDCQRLRELVHAFTSLRLPLVQLPVIFFYLKKNLLKYISFDSPWKALQNVFWG